MGSYIKYYIDKFNNEKALLEGKLRRQFLEIMERDEYAAKFPTEFQDRIYYDADVCIPTQTNMYEFNQFFKGPVENGMITCEVYEKIIRKNAEKLLGIEV